MDHEKAVTALVTILFGSACLYLGYIWGTHRMAAAYGEAISAEAIMYLVQRDMEQ